MATYYLINNVRVGTQQRFAGELVDEAHESLTPLTSAGALLWPSSDATVAAAAATAVALKKSGGSLEALESIMQTAANSVQKTTDAATTSTADLAAVTTGKGAALIGVEDAGGKFTATTVEAALAEAKTLIDAGMQVVKVSKQITSATLVALGALTSGTVDFAAALPANARLIGATVKITTKFQNAGDSNTLTADLGDGTTAAEFLAAANLHQAATEVGGTQTTHPHPLCLNFGAKTPRITFTSSVNFDTYTAGDATFNLFYFVLA